MIHTPAKTECSYSSEGEINHVIFSSERSNGHIATSYDASGNQKHTYNNDDPSCSFYSDRDAGRKKYWSKGAIPESKYAQPDKPGQSLIYYGEIDGVQKEWYYSFLTFQDMMQTLAQVAPVTIGNSIKTLMQSKPRLYRPSSNTTASHMYMASIEYNITDDKYTSSVYISCEPEELA